MRETALYAGNLPGNSFRLRQVLRHENGNLRLQAKHSAFSIITHNMALLPWPAYKGTDRDGAIMELAQRILAEPPDVVGLCEVWTDDEKNTLISLLSSVYNNNGVTGPPASPRIPVTVMVMTPIGFPIPVTIFKSGKENGGLLVLSRHPISMVNILTYDGSAGIDMLTNKGAIHIRVHPANSPNPWDIFFSHTQDIDPSGGKEKLYAQLSQLRQFVENKSNAANPTIIMGDLNIPGEIKEHYDQLVNRLGASVDLWITKNDMHSDRFTYTLDNSFYANSADAPDHNSRLDYVFLKSGLSFVPVLDDIKILNWAHEGHNISDHFGLQAKLEQCLQIDT
jgi:endonuclease/exonuclease/phosphatase family metal-dependent hydrolase